jgi:poly(3-hydroxybutyrate) depolymerase
VLLPEQSAEANPQRCWNWFRPEAVVALETGILMAMVDHLCAAHPLRRDRVYALGLSAGGAMAMSLALRYPERLVAVGTHSGAVPYSASTPLQAGQAMRGLREPRLAALHQRLAGRPLPPLIIIHGEADHGVAPANAQASAELWLDLAVSPVKDGPARTVQHGARHPHHIRDWTRAGRPYVRLVYISHLGHAWSGGTRRQAFSDPHGPDALKLAWRFFLACGK